MLLFGRITYELMAGFWPTRKPLPIVAERMNHLPNVVFSRTMKRAGWHSTTLVEDDMVGHIRRMKAEPGEGLAILGSGNLVSQLAETGLIDEYEFIVNPLALGAGRTIFQGMPQRLGLKLTQSRTLKSGKVFLSYASAETTPAHPRLLRDHVLESILSNPHVNLCPRQPQPPCRFRFVAAALP